jgi:hypothetical protein
MDFGLVILPPFASQRAGDLFWPAADLPINLGPSKMQVIGVRCSTATAEERSNALLASPESGALNQRVQGSESWCGHQ